MLLPSLFVISSNGWSGSCNIGSFTSSQLVLMPTRGSSSNMAFSMQCEQNYQIRFSSMNGVNGVNGTLMGQNGTSIRTQMKVTNEQGSLPWNNTIQQVANQRNQYILTVSILDSISSSLPAGKYTDRVSVMIDY